MYCVCAVGHATVNEEPSIGFAMEFVDSRISINLGAPRINEESVTVIEFVGVLIHFYILSFVVALMNRWFDDISVHNSHYDSRNVPRKIQTRAVEGLTYHGLNSDLHFH